MSEAAVLNFFPQDRILEQITNEFVAFLTNHDPEMAGIRLPPIAKTRDSSNGDFTVILKGACARRKIDVVKYSNELTEALNAFLKVNRSCFFCSLCFASYSLTFFLIGF